MKNYKIEVKTVVFIEAKNEQEALENAVVEIKHGLNECAVIDYEDIECIIVK